MVDDFERGPGEYQPNACSKPVFNGLKPSSNTPCDWLSVDPSSCKPDKYCEGQSICGICPSYITAGDAPYRGEYSLRLYYETQMDGFGGVILTLGERTGDDKSCLVARPAVDLTQFEYLSLWVRAGSSGANAEMALQDANGVETYPKLVLASGNNDQLTPGVWGQRKLSVCDLLHISQDGGAGHLARSQITKVLLGFAYDTLVSTGAYNDGISQLDVDDISFLPCPNAGCAPCP